MRVQCQCEEEEAGLRRHAARQEPKRINMKK